MEKNTMSLNVQFDVRGTKYFITSDENQYILERELTRKERATGKSYPDRKVVGYFPQISSLMRDLVNMSLRDEDSKTLKEMKYAFDEICKSITQQWDY